MKRTLLSLGLVLACAAVASARTPTFAELFEDQGRMNNVPITMPADIGTVFVSAPEAYIDFDASCDGLSELALYVESPANTAPFEVRFLHDHPDGGSGDLLLEERETFTLKLGAASVDKYSARVGFESRDGFQFHPIVFGPASEGLADADRFGEIYVNGEPSGMRFGNVLESVCSGDDRMDGQVLVSFDMLGGEGTYYVTVTSFAPFPQQERFGPFAIPEAVMTSGYGACMVRGQSGSGVVMLDGATCLASSVLPPIIDESDGRVHRNRNR